MPSVPTQKVATNLTDAGFPTEEHQVKAVTVDTPIPESHDLKSIGAHLVNGEGLQEGLKDLGYMAEADLKMGDKIRTTPSSNPLKMLLGKLRLKKKGNEEIVEDGGKS